MELVHSTTCKVSLAGLYSTESNKTSHWSLLDLMSNEESYLRNTLQM